MIRKVAIVGLGYAGLHTALAFGNYKKVIGYDINKQRIDELKQHIDSHGDFSADILKKSEVMYTSQLEELKKCDFYIIIVPTPVKNDLEPDLSYLEKVSVSIGSILKPGDIVVYESTVYPGATEEVCVPILEQQSNLTYKLDFQVGYSPERINPGDKVHQFSNTVKIIAGSTIDTTEIMAKEYEKTTQAGIYRVSNIQTAEAVKIVENIQRDSNIALINELAMIFHLLKVNTQEVIKAAATKWNFMPFQPGFVGGHCISVDPYYLIYKAKMLGYTPEIIATARKVNEEISHYIAQQLIKYLIKNKLIRSKTNVAILGITYKEDYNDVRNSKAVALAKELSSYGIDVLFNDPVADEELVRAEYQLHLTPWAQLPKLSAIVITVPHKKYKNIALEDYIEKLEPNGVIIDMKNALRADGNQNGVFIWKL